MGSENMGAYLIYFVFIMIIPLWAQFRVKSTYAQYQTVQNRTGITGEQVARRILDENGLYDVTIHAVKGHLTDHYDPSKKGVFLSEDNYFGTTIAGTAVAAHEVGHAIQDAQNYNFMRVRSALVPVANLSSNMAYVFILIGIIFTALNSFLLIGIALMAAGVLFQLVTLPVEFDASSRALNQLVSTGILQSDEEPQARKVLSAAAMTYVAAAAVAVMELLRLLLIYLGRRD